MPPKSNQEIERKYFERFRKNYILPDGHINYGDKPDIIIEGERRVGIEVTNFFIQKGNHPESEQNQRKVRESVLKKAQQKYLDGGGKLIDIHFSFNKDQPIQKQGKGRLISMIVDLARRIEDFETGEISKDIFKDIPELNSVFINSTLYNDPKWKPRKVHFGQKMIVARLEEILREKEEKAKKYRKCDTYWLLVVIDFFDRAQDQEIPIVGIDLKSNVYEKIIIYKTDFEHVMELK